ncbi:MAG: hypothetical protein A2068_13700 [Ignavibacteria bacterium GWB2_35_6b]|nr:MAG: hypothetical protein A2068_13700 [Ignavibacteria bacterium GWB2_35_6b]
MNLKIGKDISLLSFDEIPGYEIFQPKITHVIQPINILGNDVIVSLIEKIKDPDLSKRLKKILKPKLIIGESCSKI